MPTMMAMPCSRDDPLGLAKRHLARNGSLFAYLPIKTLVDPRLLMPVERAATAPNPCGDNP
jgi:hypothetical protein